LLFSRKDIENAKVKAKLSDNVADYAIFYDIIKTFLGNGNNYFSDIYALSMDENLVVSFVGMKEKDMKKIKILLGNLQMISYTNQEYLLLIH
jgi:hypothetical protein